MGRIICPCEMCWSRSGNASDMGVRLCFGCERDIAKAVAFLEAKGLYALFKAEEGSSLNGAKELAGLRVTRPA